MMRLSVYLLSLLLLFGCAANRYAKKAAEFETAGLYRNAAELYYQSVLKNQNKVETKLGLQRTGQMMLNDMFNNFNRDYENNETQKAVYSYIDAKNYYDKLLIVNVTLNFPEQYHSKYREVKDSYVADKYVEGTEKLNREEFIAAAEIFAEIIRIQPNFKNVKELHKQAVYEPIYRTANQNYDLERFRTAYWIFDEILSNTGGYKDAFEMKNQARSRANINLLIPDVGYAARLGNSGRLITVQQLTNAIHATENPFVTVLNKSIVDDKQLYKLNGSYNLPALNLLGVGAVLRAEVKSYNRIDEPIQVEERPAYIKKTIKYVDDQGNAKSKDVYEKTTYNAYSKTNGASITLAYEVIDTKTGAMILSDSFTKTKKETVEFGRYKGDKKSIVAGTWVDKDKKSSEDEVYDTFLKNRKLQQFLTASDRITTVESLLESAGKACCNEVAKAVNAYNPEK